MTGIHYTLTTRPMSRSDNITGVHRYHSVTFTPRLLGKTSLQAVHYSRQLADMTEAATPTGPGLVNEERSLTAHEEMSRQRHRHRQIPAHVPGLVEGRDAHDVAVRRQLHASARTQAQLIKGRQ